MYAKNVGLHLHLKGVYGDTKSECTMMTKKRGGKTTKDSGGKRKTKTR